MSNEVQNSGALRYNDGKPKLSYVVDTVFFKSFIKDPYYLEVIETIANFINRQASVQDIYYQITKYDICDNVFSMNNQELDVCCAGFDFGARKYSRNNWKKGLKVMSIVDSLLRHIVLGRMRGEEVDPESGIPHIGHVLCNLVFLAEFENTDLDDRPLADQ